MKKRFVMAFVLVLFGVLLTNVLLSASPPEDFQNHLKSATSIVMNYEESNLDYAKVIVYLASVEEELNALLGVTEGGITQKQLTEILGIPKETLWVLSEDATTEILVADPVPVWTKVLVFDGNFIQLRVNVVPILLNDQDIVYISDFSLNFKVIDSSFNIREEIDEIKILAQSFNLDPTNIEIANDLAESMVNLEKLSQDYFEQTNEECEIMFTNLFGEENKKQTQGIVTKTYELFNKKDYQVILDLSSCEGCTEYNINLDLSMKKKGKDIEYTVVETISEDQFAELGENGVKAELIEFLKELKATLIKGNYREVSPIMKKIEVLNNYWNKISSNEEDPEKSFVLRGQFLNGLMEGNPLIATNYYEEVVFEEITFREFKEEREEICNNRIDDNKNEKIDCEEDICLGQVCGTEIINVTEENKTVEKEVVLYCISKTCQQKQETPKEKRIICGNNICEVGEEDTCFKDCTICQEHPAIECSGQVIFKGEDENGCVLPPICLEKINECSVDADCGPNPLCGKVACIENTCQLTKLDQCTQAKCIEGQEKIQECESGDKILVEICSKGLWKTTGEKCDRVIEQPIKEALVKETITLKTGFCQVKEDCAGDDVCQLGECKSLAKNSNIVIKQVVEKIETGVTFTGNVVEITGKPITGTGITGVSRVGDDDLFEEPNAATVPERTYDGEKPSSSFTGIISNLEEVVIDDEGKEFVLGKSAGNRGLTEEVQEELAVTGICKKENGQVNPSLIFSGAGEKFGAIAALQEEYRKAGIEWCSSELSQELEKRKQIVNSFSSEFAGWFEDYLAYHAEDRDITKQAIYNIYQEIIQNQINIAKMMDCSGLKSLSDYDTINIIHNSDYLSLEYIEKVKKTRLEGMKREVDLINPSMKVLIPLDENLLKAQLVKAMNAHTFPSTVAERKIYGGLTRKEKTNFDNDPELKSKISNFIAVNEIKDGIIDFQLLITQISEDEKKEIIYTAYGRLTENSFKIQPMLNDEVPVGLDQKIEIPYDILFEVIKASKENERDTFAANPPWDEGGFSLTETANIVGNWVDMQLKMMSLMNSIEMYPEKQGAKDLFKDVFFLIGEEEFSDSES
ncbi:MAG: hypothetical protein ABIH59_01730 [archaeon]